MSYLSLYNYQILGPEDGRKWVFLHGLMGYVLNWRKVALDLAKTERVFVFDQRGHGQSHQPVSGYLPEDYADDLHILLEEMGWEDIILVGHSMGGRNALSFASRFPDKLKKLIIEDISPEDVNNSAQRYLTLIESIPVPFKDKKSAKDFFLNDFLKIAKGWDKANMLGQFLYSNIIEKEDGTATWRFYKDGIIQSTREGRKKSYWTEVKELSMETLWIRGENSIDLTQKTFEEVLKCNAKITGKVIANAGHWVHTDQPAEFLRVIKEFADSDMSL